MLTFKNKGMGYVEFVAVSEYLVLGLNKFAPLHCDNTRTRTLTPNAVECLGKLNFPLFVHSDGWEEISVDLVPYEKDKYSVNKVPVSEHVVNRRFPDEMLRVLSAYPKGIQGVVLNASNFYHSAKRAWSNLEHFNTKSHIQINNLIIQDYRLLAALLYNVSVRRYTDGVRGSRDGYLYSSVPIYDGKKWEKIKISPDFIKALIRLQGGGVALETHLELFVHVPEDSTR